MEDNNINDVIGEAEEKDAAGIAEEEAARTDEEVSAAMSENGEETIVNVIPKSTKILEEAVV